LTTYNTRVNHSYRAHPGTLIAMAGIHPTRASNIEYDNRNLKALRDLLSTKNKENDPNNYFSYPIIACVGECGLDYKKGGRDSAEESAAGEAGVIPGAEPSSNKEVNENENKGKQEEAAVVLIEEKDREMQKRWFEEQLKIASEFNL
jgi:Tat protein secretion system quality control protein TatD with DNase activity